MMAKILLKWAMCETGIGARTAEQLFSDYSTTMKLLKGAFRIPKRARNMVDLHRYLNVTNDNSLIIVFMAKNRYRLSHFKNVTLSFINFISSKFNQPPIENMQQLKPFIH